ncbi:MAG: helix-turn-helix transcriptional regulator [Minwuia sp.]|nr:helix-turn-helix transcriptional regulator [Minwuia sp.]
MTTDDSTTMGFMTSSPDFFARPEKTDSRSPFQITRDQTGRAVSASMDWQTFLGIATPEMLALVPDDDLAGISAARAAHDPDSRETEPLEVAERLMLGDHPIKVWREYRGLTQTELASRADTSKAYVSQLETGTRSPSRKLLTAIAAALDVPARDLLPDPND